MSIQTLEKGRESELKAEAWVRKALEQRIERRLARGDVVGAARAFGLLRAAHDRAEETETAHNELLAVVRRLG